MRARIKLVLVILIWLVLIPGWTVFAVKSGSPQAVWFWCDMLHLCQR